MNSMMEKKMSDLSLDQPSSTSGSANSSLQTTPRLYADKSGEPFTLEKAQAMTTPSEEIMCRLADNDKIRFGEYQVRDFDSKTVLLHVPEQMNHYQDEYARKREKNGQLTMDDRILKQQFSPAFFFLKMLELTLTFKVTDENKPLKDLVLIEKHYFQDQLISSYEFKFPFCIPGSTNTWQKVYELPKIDKQMQMDMIQNDFATTSDSFYFAEGKLIVHNKAAYSYSPQDNSRSQRRHSNGSSAKESSDEFD